MDYTPQMFWDNFDKLLKEKKVRLSDIFEFKSKDYVRISTAKYRNAFLRLDDVITISNYLGVSIDKLVFGFDKTNVDYDINELAEAFSKDKDTLLSVIRLINRK